MKKLIYTTLIVSIELPAISQKKGCEETIKTPLNMDMSPRKYYDFKTGSIVK